MGEIASLIQISEAKMMGFERLYNRFALLQDDLPLVESDLQPIDKPVERLRTSICADEVQTFTRTNLPIPTRTLSAMSTTSTLTRRRDGEGLYLHRFLARIEIVLV
jgi:hypothetical protein